MKRLIYLFVAIFYLLSNQPTIYAAGTTSSGESSVYDAIHEGGGKSTPSTGKEVDSGSSSIFPLFIKFIFSFIFVIVLLFLLIRFLSKRSRFTQTNGPVIPLGGHMLGNNRSLQVVLIGQTIYVLGVGETVTLIRTISNGEEYQHLMDSFEDQPDVLPGNWLATDSIKKWNTVFQNQLRKMQRENRED